jgi:radical SAM enzyme (TIGR01210 family)
MTFRNFTTAEIRSLRAPKAAVDPLRPYAFLVEPERAANGRIDDVATLFLTNRECPFTCVFCDLWRHTLDEPTPRGAIPTQIAWALAQLPAAQHIKLYNSGNFFDAQAIPPDDHPAIADLVAGFETVIVENHPRLTDDRVLPFRDRLAGRLEVALGLETVHPEILPRLNKQMTAADFSSAATWLRRHDCDVRTFVLLRPPGLSDADGVKWAVRSMRTAFDAGAHCVSVIAVRAGNGAMDQLAATGEFAPPAWSALYDGLCQGIELQAGRVFVDLWDVEKLWPCATCGPRQADVLRRMNLSQQIEPWPTCHCEPRATR